MENNVITLKYPTVIGDGSRLEKVTLRRPTVGDIVAAGVKPGSTDVNGEIKLVARLCGLTIEDLHLLDLADYMAVQNELARFLGA